MRIFIRPLDFERKENFHLPQPTDQWLFDMAMEYCRRELVEPPDFRKLSKVWVALDENNEVVGITGYVVKADIPVFRVTGEQAKRATKALYERMNSYFADQGMTGQEVFLHISSKETPEQRCPAWEESLQAVNAKPADRFSLIVR